MSNYDQIYSSISLTGNTPWNDSRGKWLLHVQYIYIFKIRFRVKYNNKNTTKSTQWGSCLIKLTHQKKLFNITQPTFIVQSQPSKHQNIERNLFKVHNKNMRTTSVFLVTLYDILYSGVSIVDFEQVGVGWKPFYNSPTRNSLITNQLSLIFSTRNNQLAVSQKVNPNTGCGKNSIVLKDPNIKSIINWEIQV